MISSRHLSALALAVFCGPFCQAQSEAPSEIFVHRASHPPRLEDFLNGPPGSAIPVTDFRQRQPGDGKEASEKTTAYLSYDDDNLYIVFVCKDEPGNVRAHMSNREDILDDDGVTVYLDTFRDRKHSYVFAVNPLGIQADGLWNDGDASPDYTFDTLWYSAGKLTKDGYVVWMSIPFKSLRFSPGENRTWGIALTRSILRVGEIDVWPFITMRKPSFLDQMAALEGLSEVSPSRNIQLIPYVFGSGARISDGATPAYQSQQEVRGGVDGKMVIHDSLTWDFTINPDFSQVETDDPQVTVNKRYEVYFPEKRPFFIEDAGYFSTPINLLFTRNIVDPEFGTRLTGKIGQWSIGALAIDDRAPGEELSPGDPLYGDHAVIGATRIQRDFGSQSYFGLMFTDRTFGPDSNQVMSFDTRIKLDPTWFFTGQFVQTFDREGSAGETPRNRQGKAYLAAVSHNDRRLNYTATYLDISPDFTSLIGFIPRVDIRQGQNVVNYFWRPEGKMILDYGFSSTITADWNRQNQLVDLNSYTQFQADFVGRTGLTLSRYDAYERYLNQGFHYRTDGASFYANWLKWLFLSGSYTQGSGVDYYPGTGIAPFVGLSRNASFDLKVRPKSRIRIEEIYYYSGLGVPRGPSVFNNHLSRTVLNYQFTRALSLRGILDYDALLSNAALYAQGTTKQLTGDVLLTYLVNPGTALYMGYNSSYQNLGLFNIGPPTYLTGRQIFVKLTYRLRF